ncbi:unnamed protein product [Ilex paraguariensis]|uniref:Uncharacterized protein n=1 Tax=Ilex paraguariensis TaxID=185542 RepID=A0ABC8U3L0_9AQUA
MLSSVYLGSLYFETPTYHQVKVVHICEATLAKRLIEFENTQSGSLTIEEFNKKAEEFEREERSIKQPNIGLEAVGTSELLCGHKSGELPFAHGLCKNCYYDFIKISGGLEGGSEPPAFQRAERERTMRKEDVSQNADDSSFVTSACQNNSKHLNVPTDGNFNFFLFT